MGKDEAANERCWYDAWREQDPATAVQTTITAEDMYSPVDEYL